MSESFLLMSIWEMEALLFLLRISFFFFSYKTGNLKKTVGLYLYTRRFLLKGSVEKQVFILQGFLKHTSSYLKKKKSPNWLNLTFPSSFLFLQSLFSKPTSLKMTFIDFHSMRVILQNEHGGVRERNLPCVTCGIGVPLYQVLLYLFCFLYPETCTLGIIRSSVSWSELEYSILIDQFMCSFIQQTFIEQACPKHWRY